MTIGHRLRYVLNQFELDQEDIANIAGVSQSLISQVISGKVKKTGYIVEICDAIQELIKREVPQLVQFIQLGKGEDPTVNPFVIENRKEAPIFTWEEVVEKWNKVKEIDLTKYNKSNVLTATRQNEECFGVEIEDEAMAYPKDRSDIAFYPGEIILIDPTIQPIPNKNYVVAYRKNTNKAFFRKYIDIAGELFLRANNSSFPNQHIPIDDSIVICGVYIKKSQRPND